MAFVLGSDDRAAYADVFSQLIKVINSCKSASDMIIFGAHYVDLSTNILSRARIL